MNMSGEFLMPEFFGRPAVEVARDLLGKHLVRQFGACVKKSRIIETEAYEGPHDLACHASRGRTKRTEVMFGPPGTLYVYRIYGLNWMLNVVTDRAEFPAAVLIRAVEGVTGPGRIAVAFGIDGSLNGRPASLNAGLWFEDGLKLSNEKVARTARIGVDYSGPIWATKKLRFLLTPKILRP